MTHVMTVGASRGIAGLREADNDGFFSDNGQAVARCTLT